MGGLGEEEWFKYTFLTACLFPGKLANSGFLSLTRVLVTIRNLSDVIC